MEVLIVTIIIQMIISNNVATSDDECGTCCEVPTNFTNGIIIPIDIKLAGLSVVPEFSTMRFECYDGYVLDGIYGSVCMQRKWFPKIPLCTPLEVTTLDSSNVRKTSCEIPKDFVNGKLRTVQVETRNLSIVPEGTILQFKCDNQYELKGARRVTCKDGVWFPLLPVCAALEVTTLDSSNVRKTSCEIPKDFVNGKLRTVQVETRNLSIVPEGTILQFKCDNQYELKGARRVTCKDGVWFPLLPVCAALEVTTLDSSNVRKTSCEIPKDFVNGKLRTVQVETRNLSIVPEGTILQFKCDNQYELKGARRVTCKDGVWFPLLPVCAVNVFCSIPDSIPNGQIYGKKRGDFYLVDDEIMIVCDYGYTVGNKSDYLYCNVDGQWDEDIPECILDSNFENKRDNGFRTTSLLNKDVMQQVERRKFKLPDEISHFREKRLGFNQFGRLIFLFIFDVSGSVQEYVFLKSIRFAKAMVQVIGVNETGTRVGAITFNNEAHIEFYPFDFNNTEDVFYALDNIQYKKGGTAITSALKILKENMIPLCDEFFREYSKYIVFLMTDGKYNIAGNPRHEADILKKDDDVEIYCIGITGERRMVTLYNVASSKRHIFILDEYESVYYLVQEIVNETIDYSKCGVRQSVIVETEGDSRVHVVKGKQVVKPWPWMALIRFKNSDGICGATLIDRKWILTAAHCTHWKNNENVIIWREKEEFKIKLGVTDLSNKTYLQERSILRYIVHDSYDYNTYDYNIALMELSTPVHYNDFVRPVCLPPSESELDTEPTLYRAGEKAKTVGWGYDKFIKSGRLVNMKYRKVSKEITLTLQKRQTCEDSLENHNDLIFTNQMICTSENDGAICKGDDGGPLMQKLVDDIGEEYWTEVGIISWGIGCAPNTYDFYTKVSMFVEWIKETIKTL